MGSVRGRRGRGGGSASGYFKNQRGSVTHRVGIAEGFCDFYCQVGPKLASRIGGVRDGAFLEYMGDRVEESLIWSPTTLGEVEEMCRGLVPGKGAGWDGVSPRRLGGWRVSWRGLSPGCLTVA